MATRTTMPSLLTSPAATYVISHHGRACARTSLLGIRKFLIKF